MTSIDHFLAYDRGSFDRLKLLVKTGGGLDCPTLKPGHECAS